MAVFMLFLYKLTFNLTKLTTKSQLYEFDFGLGAVGETA